MVLLRNGALALVISLSACLGIATHSGPALPLFDEPPGSWPTSTLPGLCPLHGRPTLLAPFWTCTFTVFPWNGRVWQWLYFPCQSHRRDIAKGEGREGHLSSGICLWGFHKDPSFSFLTERGSIKGERQNPFHWPLALLTLERTLLCLFPA